MEPLALKGNSNLLGIMTSTSSNTFDDATVEYVVGTVLAADSESPYRHALKQAGVESMIDLLELSSQDLHSLKWNNQGNTVVKLNLVQVKRILTIIAWYQSQDDLNNVNWFSLTAGVLRQFRETRTTLKRSVFYSSTVSARMPLAQTMIASTNKDLAEGTETSAAAYPTIKETKRMDAVTDHPNDGNAPSVFGDVLPACAAVVKNYMGGGKHPMSDCETEDIDDILYLDLKPEVLSNAFLDLEIQLPELEQNGEQQMCLLDVQLPELEKNGEKVIHHIQDEIDTMLSVSLNVFLDLTVDSATWTMFENKENLVDTPYLEPHHFWDGENHSDTID